MISTVRPADLVGQRAPAGENPACRSERALAGDERAEQRAAGRLSHAVGTSSGVGALVDHGLGIVRVVPRVVAARNADEAPADGAEERRGEAQDEQAGHAPQPRRDVVLALALKHLLVGSRTCA